MTRSASIWLPCEEPGCPNGINAVAAHLPNLTAPGGWTCPTHDQESP